MMMMATTANSSAQRQRFLARQPRWMEEKGKKRSLEKLHPKKLERSGLLRHIPSRRDGRTQIYVAVTRKSESSSSLFSITHSPCALVSFFLVGPSTPHFLDEMLLAPKTDANQRLSFGRNTLSHRRHPIPWYGNIRRECVQYSMM